MIMRLQMIIPIMNDLKTFSCHCAPVHQPVLPPVRKQHWRWRASSCLWPRPPVDKDDHADDRDCNEYLAKMIIMIMMMMMMTLPIFGLLRGTEWLNHRLLLSLSGWPDAPWVLSMMKIIIIIWERIIIIVIILISWKIITIILTIT